MDDWQFFPSCDIGGHDITYLPGRTSEELMELARQLPECLAFNTNGWMKNTSEGIRKVPDFDHGGLFVNNRKQKETEFFHQMMLEKRSQFQECFIVKNIDGVVLQKLGVKGYSLTLARDDKNLRYEQIIIININNSLMIETELSKIFYNNFILSTAVKEYDQDFFPNLILGQKDHELINRLGVEPTLRV